MITNLRRGGLAASAAGVLALTAACATADPQEQAEAGAADGGDRQCFLASQVRGFHALDNDTVHVTVGARDVHELQLFGTCHNVNWSQQIGIRSTGGSPWVCRGLDAELVVPGPMGTDRCLVRTVRQLSEAEAEALRRAH